MGPDTRPLFSGGNKSRCRRELLQWRFSAGTIILVSLHSSTRRTTPKSLLWSSRNDGQSFLGSYPKSSSSARSSVSSLLNGTTFRPFWSFREAPQTSTGACKQLKVSVTKIRRRYQGPNNARAAGPGLIHQGKHAEQQQRQEFRPDRADTGNNQ